MGRDEGACAALTLAILVLPNGAEGLDNRVLSMHSGTARGAADILIFEFDSDLYYISAHPLLTA
jgi:hypothetical protein